MTRQGMLSGPGGARARDGSPIMSARVQIPRVTALARERVDARLGEIWQRRLGIIAAPAGSGKTTLLARFATSARVPVAWYRAEARDADVGELLRYLEVAFRRAIPSLTGPWRTVEEAVAALERLDPTGSRGRHLLVIDDLHTLEATPAEAALERFVEYAPPSLAILVGTRMPPAFNLSRLRVSGALLEIDADEIRFRIWEVERLFRDFYGASFGPEELATVARRTAGWAAGLQLFHLATSGKPPDERRRILAGMSSSARLVREYLTWNVLDQLPEGLRRFLVETSVLPMLSGPLCDRFLGRSGSAAMLRELERRQIFTVALDDEGAYRYHEVLRTTLEAVFRDTHGEAALHDAHRRAGELLVAAGAMPEALTAFCRGGAWDLAERLIREAGQDLVDRPDRNWLEAIPPSLLRQDPWLVLATARRHRAEGRWTAAVEAYQRAEAGFGNGAAQLDCRRERLAVAVWLEPPPGLATDWSSRLRLAAARDPQVPRRDGQARAIPGAGGDDDHTRLVDGLTLLLAGNVRDARAALARLADDTLDPPSGPGEAGGEAAGTSAVRVTAQLGAGVAGVLSGDARARQDLQAAIGAAERAGLGWLSRVGRAVLALAEEGRGTAGVDPAMADAIRAGFARDGDRWTYALLGLLRAWSAPDAAGRTGDLAASARTFRELNAGTLEAWARGLLALASARAGSADAAELVKEADTAARGSATPGARLLVALSRELVEPERSPSHRALAEAMAAETGLAVPSGAAAPMPPASAPPAPAMVRPAATPSVVVRCFGGFQMDVGGRPVDLAGVKPRARAVLRLLATHTGSLVHREVLQDAFWPEAAGETAGRLLQVAISSLRSALEPGVGRGASSMIIREADAYRLALPADADADMVAFERLVADGRAARARGAIAVAEQAFERALSRYAGDVLPEDGPAEWVVELRDRCRVAAVEASLALGELRLASGHAAGAVEACTAGLRIDRFHDPLWRLLVGAHEVAGDRGAAVRAQQGYDRMLAELGI